MGVIDLALMLLVLGYFFVLAANVLHDVYLREDRRRYQQLQDIWNEIQQEGGTYE